MLHWLFFFIVLFFSCSHPTADVLIEKTIRKANNQKFEQYGIYEVGFGGGGWPSVKRIGATYVTANYRINSVDDAREFFCKFWEDFARSYNDEPSIRPYLANYPLTGDNIELSITFLDEKGEELQKPYIGTIRNRKGTLYYKGYDPTAGQTVFAQYPTIYQEPFEEGYAIYQKEKVGSP